MTGFKPYVYKWTDYKGCLLEHSFIALVDEDVVVRLTTWDRFARPSKNLANINASNNDRIRRVCNFLNYVMFKHYFRYHFTKITDITFEAVRDYLLHYAVTENEKGMTPGKQSVMKERNAVCLFMSNVVPFQKPSIHFYAKKVLAGKSTKSLFGKESNPVAVYEYEIEAEYLEDRANPLVRDIPQKAIPIIMKWVRIKAPDLYFAVVLQLFVGLREGEVVNVRRPHSDYPGGITIEKVNGHFTRFDIDLKRKYKLRSDGNNVGGIKRKRVQSTYPRFLPIVQKAYEEHLKRVPDSEIESAGPMFVTLYRNNNTGKRMALTKQSYCNRITNIIKTYVIPELLRSGSPELESFALQVNENSWGLHAFRHWFTVQLVLDTDNPNTIASFRGMHPSFLLMLICKTRENLCRDTSR